MTVAFKVVFALCATITSISSKAGNGYIVFDPTWIDISDGEDFAITFRAVHRLMGARLQSLKALYKGGPYI